MQLVEVADALYALAPAEFTKARDTAVREARSAKDAELAAEVKQLRRPPVSAWAVNMLARHRSGPLDELLALGGELRQAQATLAGAQLRTLSSQRHRVIASLTDEARALVAETGHKLADDATREISATLEAALVDESAAAAVRSGRLMRSLTSTGLEPVELMGAVAAPGDVAALPPALPPVKRAPAASAKGEQRSQRVERARAKAVAARAAATETAHALELAEHAAGAAAHAASDAERRIAELAEAIKHAKADHAIAAAERRRTERKRDAAVSANSAARRAAAQADSVLARLTD